MEPGHATSVVVILLLALLGAGWSVPAEAHTDLVASTPRAGDTVTTATDRVVLAFSSALVPGSGDVVVRDGRGVDVVSRAPTVSEQTLEVQVRLRGPGPHEVTYRVLADDGHVVVGEMSFDVAEQGSPRSTAEQGTPRSAPAGPAPPPPSASTGPESAGDAIPWPVWWGLAAALVALLLLQRRLRPARPVD